MNPGFGPTNLRLDFTLEQDKDEINHSTGHQVLQRLWTSYWGI